MISAMRYAFMLMVLITLYGLPTASVVKSQSVSAKKPLQFGLLPYLSTLKLHSNVVIASTLRSIEKPGSFPNPRPEGFSVETGEL